MIYGAGETKQLSQIISPPACEINRSDWFSVPSSWGKCLSVAASLWIVIDELLGMLARL